MKRYFFAFILAKMLLTTASAINLHVAEAEAETHISLHQPAPSPVPNDGGNEDGGGGFFEFVRRMLKRKKKKKNTKKKPKVVNVNKPCKCNQPEPPNVDLLAAVDWTLVFAFADRPPWLLADESEQTWAKLLRRSPNKIIKRRCFKCVGSHQHIYYRRLTKVEGRRITEEFNPRPYFRDVWQDFDNKLNQDFALYSTYKDAIQDTNRWMYCNYNDVRNGIGFPRDCGPVAKTNNQWNSFLSGHGQKNFEYYIEGANGVVVPPSRPPTVVPSATGPQGCTDPNAEFKKFENFCWTRVRHVPSGSTWHPARDQLLGTHVYGDPANDAEAWSTRFDSADFDNFLFATGDMTKWLIAQKEQVIGGFYANEKRVIVRSSLDMGPHSVRWYRRAGNLEDPWISLTDHGPAIGEGNIIYGENSFGRSHATNILPHHNGADVYIAKKSCVMCL